MKFQATETKTIVATLKPAKRPKYNSRDINSTLEAAARISLAHGCKVQAVPTYYGLSLVIEQGDITCGDYYFETDGKTVTRYERIRNS